jgi:hypothetical protein
MNSRLRTVLNRLPWYCVVMTLICFAHLFAKHRILSSFYLSSAERLGKSYARSVPYEGRDDMRKVLEAAANNDEYNNFVVNLYVDFRLQKRYNETLLSAFEEELKVQEKREIRLGL